MSSPQEPAVPSTARRRTACPRHPAPCRSRSTPRSRRSRSPTAPGRTTHHHRRPLLVQRRPARRQPGADRPDDARAQARMFELLVRMGYKEIEVGFPAASQTDFDFVRQLVEDDLVPDDVTIQVLTQARDELIERTFESLARCRAGDRAPLQLDVDRCSAGSCSAWTATASTTSPSRAPSWCRKLAEQMPGTDDPLRVLARVVHRHRARLRRRGLQRRHRRLGADAGPADDHQPAGDRRDGRRPTSTPTRSSGCTATSAAATRVVLSPAPAQRPRHRRRRRRAGLPAGADRIEGCLFGNGERTGNVDLVTLGLNLFSQGIDPQIDFSDIDEIRRTVEYCNQLPRPRAPPLRRRPGLHRVLRLAPGRHQEGLRRARAPTPPRPARPSTRSRGRCRTCRSTPRTSAAATRPSSG